DLYESSRHGWPPGFLLVHLRYLSPKQLFLLYRCARCFAPLHRGASVAPASRSAKRRSGVGTVSPHRTSWRPFRSLIPLDEGAETVMALPAMSVFISRTNDFDLCLEATGEAGPELNLGGLGIQGYGCAGGSQLLVELVAMEMARFDASIATF